jgi:predicted DNA-binding transcriptional regulator AlpA
LRELLHRTEFEFLCQGSQSPVVPEERLVARIADVIARFADAKDSSRERTRYVREGEAAKYIGVTVSTLRSWRTKRSKNSPPYTRLGRMVMYPVAELDGHMRARMVSSRD